jgi:protein-tyrosine phosphatase
VVDHREVIDVHCHILPGVDDGPRTLAESVAMARQAQADGITVVCATPHIRADHDVRIAELAGRVRAVNEAVEGDGLAVRIASGGEVAEETALTLTDAELRAVTLGGGARWLLLEPRPGPLAGTLDAVVSALAARGLRSVVAHPERHAGEDLGDRLAALVDAGALVQLTAALLTDPGAGPPMLALAARGLVHVLGSDAHHPAFGRRVELSQGLARLREAPRVRDHLGWIAQTAPAALLAGEDPAVPYRAG